MAQFGFPIYRGKFPPVFPLHQFFIERTQFFKDTEHDNLFVLHFIKLGKNVNQKLQVTVKTIWQFSRLKTQQKLSLLGELVRP